MGFETVCPEKDRQRAFYSPLGCTWLYLAGLGCTRLYLAELGFTWYVLKGLKMFGTLKPKCHQMDGLDFSRQVHF